jgi:hypothetical protein
LPSELGQLTALTSKFHVCCNSFTGQLPSQLGQLTNLEEVMYLDENHFTGPIPTDLGALTNLEASLYLHQNSFTGTIPTQLGLLEKMKESLSLSFNQLTGPIPSELGKLTRMTHFMHLNDNSLSGELPSELGRLTSMTSWFYVFNNELCGRVPPQVKALADGTTGKIPPAAAWPNWALDTGNHLNISCDALDQPTNPASSSSGVSQATLAAIFIALSVCVVLSAAGYAIRQSKLQASSSYSQEETERMSKMFESAGRSGGRSTSREREPPSSLEALENELGHFENSSGSGVSRRPLASSNLAAVV